MREINELEHWITDKEALAGGEEMGKDLEHVQALIKKAEDFEKDVEGNEVRLDSINKMGEDMLEEGHSDADEIQRICEVREKFVIKTYLRGVFHSEETWVVVE